MVFDDTVPDRQASSPALQPATPLAPRKTGNTTRPPGNVLDHNAFGSSHLPIPHQHIHDANKHSTIIHQRSRRGRLMQYLMLCYFFTVCIKRYLSRSFNSSSFS